MLYLLPALAFGYYLLGTIAHELTHALATVATGSVLVQVSLWPPFVDYKAKSGYAEGIIRTATVGVSVPILVVYIMWLQAGVELAKLAAGAFVIGYLPRSRTDWEPFAAIIKSLRTQ